MVFADKHSKHCECQTSSEMPSPAVNHPAEFILETIPHSHPVFGAVSAWHARSQFSQLINERSLLALTRVYRMFTIRFVQFGPVFRTPAFLRTVWILTFSGHCKTISFPIGTGTPLQKKLSRFSSIKKKYACQFCSCPDWNSRLHCLVWVNLLAEALSKLVLSESRTMKETVLLLPGAFCPIHVGHLAILEQARAALENVTVAYLLPSTKSYVGRKVGHDHSLVPLERRIELCRLATEHLDWIKVLDWGLASGNKARRRLQRWHRDARVVIVAGADTSRNPENPDLYVAPRTQRDVSSTLIRQAMARKDWTTIQDLVDRRVLQAIREKE
jgi:cytidyltransferase-like protein